MAWLTTGGPATNSWEMSRTITEKWPEHRLRRTDADDAAQQQVDDRHRCQLLGVVGAAEMAGQERAAAAHHARLADLDGAGAFLGRCFRAGALLRHHGGDAAAARRAVEQADRGRPDLDRQPVEVARLLADRAVGMAAARGEVVGADDAGTTLDAALAADMAGRRELGDLAGVVEAREAREAADLAEAAAVEQHVDALAAGELVAVALAHHAGLARARGQALVRDRLQRGDLVEHRRPALVPGHDRRCLCRPGRLDDGEDLPAVHGIAGRDRRHALDDAGARRADGTLHLHRRDDEQRLAGASPCRRRAP